MTKQLSMDEILDQAFEKVVGFIPRAKKEDFERVTDGQRKQSARVVRFNERGTAEDL